MKTTLATTWYPRGELPRFSRLLPVLLQQYSAIVISYIPGNNDILQEFVSGAFSSSPDIVFYKNEDQKMGRYLSLKLALETGSDFIHYADMDRLLRWVETNPEEWKHMVSQVEKFDCLIFGRTDQAMRTHPQAMTVTEKLSNQVVSHYLGVEMDVSAGSKSFSREAAQYLIDHGRHDNSIGTDAEWPILLKQAGFKLEYIEVNGLDWESADHYRSQAATPAEQLQAAIQYDSNPDHWSKRVSIAGEIIRSALQVGQNKFLDRTSDHFDQDKFDLAAVFDVDDYLYFYSESLTDERTEAEVSALVRLLELDAPKKILDLACGFGRHTNRLAALGHSMTGIDLMPGFLDIARKDALQRNVTVEYCLGDMRKLTYENEFDIVLLLFTAFGYFTDDENLQVLVNIKNALKAGGVFVFDTHNRDLTLQQMHPVFIVEKDGNMMIDRLSFDSLQGRFYNKRVVFRDGVRKDKPFFVRYYNPNEINTLLSQAGLELLHIYGGWDLQELTSKSRGMVVVARKP